MPRFRPRTEPTPAPLSDPVRLLDDVFRPRHWYVGSGLSVSFQAAVGEELAWEIYQGRLLDATQTRQRRSFLSWNLVERDSAQPLVSLKYDAPARIVYVVRGLLCHGWESFDSGGNVVETREATHWTSELVGALALADFADEGDLRDELICRLWQAVVGTSRLPLTSLEAPLPGFVLGQLAYVYRPDQAMSPDSAAPLSHWRELMDHGWHSELASQEQAKLLEMALRTVTSSELPAATAQCVARWHALGWCPRGLIPLLKTLFNDVSLSPWTGWVSRALEFLQNLVRLEACPAVDEIDFLSWLLRQLGRHLTAYDLIIFHHRGANYPDALLLDAALKQTLQLADREPKAFLDSTGAARQRRRALRIGALLRRIYEGHAVPEAPTSPGENARVLPPPFTRVSEEQLLNPRQRVRRLFAEDPLADLWSPTTREVFRQSLADLCQPAERIDLGTAVFVDRPLGVGKELLEPDQTPLLAHEVLSLSIANRRMDELKTLATDLGIGMPDSWATWTVESPRDIDLETLAPVRYCAGLGRPVAALADAQRVSEDGGVLRTLPSSLRRLRTVFDWDALLVRFRLDRFWRNESTRCLRLAWGAGNSFMAWLDGERHLRLAFESDPAQGYRSRGGIELPVAGLRVWSVRDDDGVNHDLRDEEVHVLPRRHDFAK